MSEHEGAKVDAVDVADMADMRVYGSAGVGVNTGAGVNVSFDRGYTTITGLSDERLRDMVKLLKEHHCADLTQYVAPSHYMPSNSFIVSDNKVIAKGLAASVNRELVEILIE